MNEEEKNVYKCLFEYPTKKIANLEIENLKLHQELDQYKNNWEELKKWIKEETERLMKIEQTNNVVFLIGAYNEALDKMKELEERK